jgi:hypothetical protein
MNWRNLKMTDYKQIADELYKALKEADRYLPNDRLFSNISDTIHKYEELISKGTGRTTALYMKAITEALENPGKDVEFIDHYPHTWMIARQHAFNMENIIKKLGYEIVVSTKGRAQVYLYNRFGQ